MDNAKSRVAFATEKQFKLREAFKKKLIKSVDLIHKGGFLDPKSTLFRLFGPIFCYFSSNIRYIKFCENSEVELNMFYGWWV